MRYILINDTSATHNPGCQATVASLGELHAADGWLCCASIPVGTGYAAFATFADRVAKGDFAPASSEPSERPEADSSAETDQGAVRWLRRWFGPSGAPAPTPVVSPMDELFSQSMRELMTHTDVDFADCDHVVINGEGTLHHDRVAAYGLLGWAAIAKSFGKSVSIVNCTVDSFSPVFFELLRRHVDHLVVRESLSHAYVRPQFDRVIQGADAIFATQRPRQTKAEDADRVAYTPGVLSYENIVTRETVGRHLRQLRGRFWHVDFIVAETEDEAFVDLAIHLGCNIIALGDHRGDDVVDMLTQYRLLVSGRYHYCIFGLLAGVNVVPLHSNTWKMDGLFRFASGHAGNVVQPTMPLTHDANLTFDDQDMPVGVPVWSQTDFDFDRLAQLARQNRIDTAESATRVAAA